VSDIDGLIQAVDAQSAIIKAQTATVEALLQSVAMLAGAVAQLLEEEAGTPAAPEEPAKPEHTTLDDDE
jgi:cell division protein FtsB